MRDGSFPTKFIKIELICRDRTEMSIQDSGTNQVYYCMPQSHYLIALNDFRTFAGKKGIGIKK